MDIAIQIPGTWPSVPAIRGVTIEMRPRDPAVPDEYQRLSKGRLLPQHLQTLQTHTAILRATVAGGTTDGAKMLLEAGAALLSADGVAVHVEASALVRSKEEWVELAQRPDDRGLYHAFVDIDRSDTTAASRGMQTFGLRDAKITVATGEWVPPDVKLKTFVHYCFVTRPELLDGDLYCDSPSYQPVYRLDTGAGPTPSSSGVWVLSETGPTPVVDLTDIVAVSAGGHGLALGADGSVWTWGTSHVYGEGRPTSYDRPHRVEGVPAGAAAISAGARHSLVLCADGSVWSFGDNRYGQLGDGTTIPSESAVPVDGLSGAIAISAGSDHSMALLADGSIVTWGSNTHGQLGYGTQSQGPSPTPLPVPAVRASAIAAGGGHSLALRPDGSVVWCGYVPVDEGVIIEWAPTFRAVDLEEPATSVDADSHSLAVLAGGSVAAWESNFGGQLGDGTRRARLVPTTVGGLPGRVVSVAAGNHHSLALLEDGGLLTWGGPSAEPTPVPVGEVVAMSAGTSMSVALKRDSTVVSWGSNIGGQLGARRCHVGPSLGELPTAPASPTATASLESLARLSVRFRTLPGATARLGGTKLGGRPDLPADMAWPEIDGVPQAFVAQVDVAEVMDAVRDVHPETARGAGLLAFFCDSAFRISGEGFDELGCEVVPIPSGAVLVRRDLPEALADEWRFAELPLSPEAEIMDVPVEAWEVEELGLTYDQIRAWAERLAYPEDERHRMFGYPEPVQNEPRRWNNETLLLQVDADTDAGMDWGDAGRVFYLIRQDELAASELGNVRLVYQCH